MHKKYFSVMNVSFQKHIEYRFNNFVWMLFSFIPFSTGLLVWFAVYNNSGDNSFTYSINEIITYYYITLIVVNLLDVGIDERSISNDIKTGDINKYLIKPINFMGYNFFSSLPKILNFLIVGFFPITIIGIFLRDYIKITNNGVYYFLFILSIAIGYIIHFLIKYLLSIITFFMGSVTSLYMTIGIFKGIVSGEIFPLSILPDHIYKILEVSPFQYLGFFSTSILQGRLTYHDIIKSLLISCIWIIILYLLCKLVWRRGLYKYSTFGG